MVNPVMSMSRGKRWVHVDPEVVAWGKRHAWKTERSRWRTLLRGAMRGLEEPELRDVRPVFTERDIS